MVNENNLFLFAITENPIINYQTKNIDQKVKLWIFYLAS